MTRLQRTRRLAAVAVAAMAAFATPAGAFDAGPHSDMTRDALTSEGFGRAAADVGVVENWFVDYYWNAKSNPFSGYADFKTKAAANVDVADIEFWPKAVIKGTDHMHFDSSEFPDLRNNKGIEEEWQRMMKLTRGQLARAKSFQDPLAVVATIGMTLHTVQDFYAHTNWVETKGEYGSTDGPDWSREFGSHPTYFDIRRGIRLFEGQIYSGVRGAARGHGKWNTDQNESHARGLNKDWPGRPLFQKAYVTSYFASRQWIRAMREWLGDDALWARAQSLAAPKGLRSDLRASFDVSKYSGHWQGNGEPCKNAVVACGELKGAAGSVLGLRSAIKTYHEDHNVSQARRKFEQIAPVFRLDSPAPVVADPASSRDVQGLTRFVQLEVQQMRGFSGELGDPGPDDADLFASAHIRGQAFESPVIHDHDRFGFPKPYRAFTWLRSVPADWRASEPVSSLTVRVRTGDRRFAGTDDDVFMRVGRGLRFDLDKRAYDDFERGDDDTYAVRIDDIQRDGLSVADIATAQIEKSPDRLAGGWFLRSFEVRVNGRVIVSETVNRWLENDRRTARAAITHDRRTSDVVPVRLALGEDDYLYGGDDEGDINPLDRNRFAALGYVPGPDVVRVHTGGDRHAGRLSKQNGEKGQTRIRLSTIQLVPPPPLPVPPPVPTPTPTPVPGSDPDLVVTEFGYFSITVRNRGDRAAGPFSITATGYPPIRSGGLAGGESRTFRSGLVCQGGTYHAVVDSGNEITESDETNNTAETQQLC